MKTTTKLLLSLFIGFGLVSCSDDNTNLETGLGDKEAAGFVLTDAEKSLVDLKNNGFYVVNEDWFGHSNGSINYFNPDGTVEYRAYRNANPGEEFGVTTATGTIYGDNMYFLSKQGNRLVIADKNTLKKKKSFKNIGSDGRSFVGVSATKGYISMSGAIRPLDLENFKLGEMITGISNNENGNMVYANNHIVVIGQRDGTTADHGAFLVDVLKDEVVRNLEIAGAISVVRSKDGDIWVITSNSLVCVDPVTFEKKGEPVDISPAGGASGSWGAWNAGPLAASNAENALFWKSGRSLHKYDIDKKQLAAKIFTLGKEADHEVQNDFLAEGETATNEQLSFYGAAVRIHPVSGDAYVQVKKADWGPNGSYNWIFVIDTNGQLVKKIIVSDDKEEGSTINPRYYWFPSHPLFKDECKPQILVEKVELEVEKPLEIALDKVIYDEDTSAFLADVTLKVAEEGVASFELKNNKLFATPLAQGVTTLTITVNSNGNVVEKTIEVSVLTK